MQDKTVDGRSIPLHAEIRLVFGKCWGIGPLAYQYWGTKEGEHSRIWKQIHEDLILTSTPTAADLGHARAVALIDALPKKIRTVHSAVYEAVEKGERGQQDLHLV